MPGEGMQSLTAALAPIAQAGINYAVADLSSAKAKERNMELMKYANDMSISNWNMQNQYNAPTAQMARLAEAGLNPNMLYGSGTQAAGNAGDIGKVSAPTLQYRMEPPQVLSMLGQTQDIKLKQAQIDNVNAQTQTRNLENEFLSGSMQDRIYKVLNDAGLTRSKNVIENAKVNGLFSYANQKGVFPTSFATNGRERTAGTYYGDLYMMELQKTQQSIDSMELQNQMRDMQNYMYSITPDLYKQQDKLWKNPRGIGSSIMKNLMKRIGNVDIKGIAGVAKML